jgi:hypothetical protein
MKCVPTVARYGVVAQSGGEDLDVAFVAEVVEQHEAAATDPRVGMFEGCTAKEIERDSSAGTKLGEVTARSRDV